MKRPCGIAIRAGVCLLLPLLIFCGNAQAGGRNLRKGLIVFVGQDARGKVAFAIEQMRPGGKLLDKFASPLSAWLYDDQTGWVKIRSRQGGVFSGEKAKKIGGDWQYFPDFGYHTKMAIRSEFNDIHLSFRDARELLKHSDASGELIFAVGEGTLVWKNRRVTGKVYLREVGLEDGESELTEGIIPAGRHFESLYMSVGSGGFIHAWRQNLSLLSKVSGEQGITVSIGAKNVLVQELQFLATAWKPIGFFEMPVEWQGTFVFEGKAAIFKVTTGELRNTKNLFIRGSRIGWVKGFVSIGGESYPLFGLSQVSSKFDARNGIEETEQRLKPAEDMQGTSWEALAR